MPVFALRAHVHQQMQSIYWNTVSQYTATAWVPHHGAQQNTDVCPALRNRHNLPLCMVLLKHKQSGLGPD